MCNKCEEMYPGEEHGDHSEVFSDYYTPEEKEVMIPVKVRYHRATNVVFSVQELTKEDIHNYLRDSGYLI